MKPPILIVRSFLVSESLASLPSSDTDWPCHIGSMPDSADVSVCLYDTAAMKDGRLMDGETIDHPGIQVKIRCKDYQVGWRKISAISASLDFLNREEITIDSETYLIENMNRASSIMPMGIAKDDTKRRYLFSVNYTMTIKEIT